MSFNTIKNRVRNEYEEKRSRFICDLIPCLSIEDLKTHIKMVKDEFPDATHHCYGYIGIPFSNEIEFKDDGEPAGTAGASILNTLKSNSLEGVLAIVTRYFGGIKLGANGLSSAYAKAVQKSINNAKIVCMENSCYISFALDYSSFELLKKNSNFTFNIVSLEYQSDVNIILALPKASLEEFVQYLSGLTSSDFQVKIIKEDYVSY